MENRISRRNFIKTSAVTGVALIAGTLANTAIRLGLLSVHQTEEAWQELESRNVDGQEFLRCMERKGYLTRREQFTMQGKSIPEIFLTKPQTDTTFNVALLLDRSVLNKTFVLENIYYDLDKYNIRADASPELDKIVVILKDNPTLKLELSSHTDVRAADAYNMKLSQNRAKAAVDYIVSQGISADRLVAKGYGETRLVVKNAKTEEEHQRNRRTEIKILEL